jgi:hypothetical protein
MPPARTGVADYSAALLRRLRARGRVELDSSADVNLYHLGNNQLHADVYHRALREPGIAVLHDAVLNHLFLGSLTKEEYVAEFVYNYGKWSREMAESLWRDRAAAASDPRYFEYPMLRRIADTSRALVVHNPAAAATVRSHAPDARVVEIAHLFEDPAPPPRAEIESVRSALEIPYDATVASVFGYLRESKRILPILRTLHRMQPSRIVLLLAGSIASRDLARAIEPYAGEPWLRRVSHAPSRKFWLLAFATDVCINLRYPAAGETSGIGVRLMGIGKPVLMTAGSEIERIPESSCIRVDHGLSEEAQLAAMLAWLESNRRDAADIGRGAREYTLREHDPERCTDAYWQTLTAVAR